LKNAPSILVFAGSARAESLNKKLAAAAARSAEAAGAEVTVLDMGEYRLPLYDGDLEDGSGVPEEVRTLKQMFARADGFLVASPEYNGSLSPLLKNLIDWLSRKDANAPDLNAFQGKVAGLLAASPGALGGVRGLAHLQQILVGLGTHVVPRQHAMKQASSKMNGNSVIDDETDAAAVAGVAELTVSVAAALSIRATP
jgi:chromate reductase, NAD(P)H dehydrogenase (quinone)